MPMLMMTASELTQLQSQLADYPDALTALQCIEDCDGDIQDAALSLALKAGLEPDTNETWLSSFAKRYRHIICQTQFRQDLQTDKVVGLISCLTEETTCPALLTAPVALYVIKSGVNDFCHSFDHSRVA